MKIYRGPSEKDFNDDTHQLVSQVEIASDIDPWTKRKTFRVNLTKAGWERKSVGHIVLEEQDILTLHSALVNGLQSQSALCGELQEQIISLRKALQDIYMYASIASSHTATQNLEKIKNRAKEVLGQ